MHKSTEHHSDHNDSDMFGHQMLVHLRPDDVPQCVILFIQGKQTCIWHLGVFNYCDPEKEFEQEY